MALQSFGLQAGRSTEVTLNKLDRCEGACSRIVVKRPQKWWFAKVAGPTNLSKVDGGNAG